MGDIVTDVGDEVSLGLFNGEAGDLFQHFELALLDHRHFLLLGVHGGDLAVEVIALLFYGIDLAVKIFFLLLQAAFLLLQLGTACLFLPLVFGAAFVYFFLCLDESFTFLALGTLY